LLIVYGGLGIMSGAGLLLRMSKVNRNPSSRASSQIFNLGS
jgi:hypothetical protein